MSSSNSRTAPTPVRNHHNVAKAFYGTLSQEGFTPEQVIALANHLLGLVADDLIQESPAVAAK